MTAARLPAAFATGLDPLWRTPGNTGSEFAALTAEFGSRSSVGQTGRCRDNALAESFFVTLESELGVDRRWRSRAAAHHEVFEYSESWYNLRRLHSSLGYLSPVEYEAALTA
ncbi:integrase core domain-containing protein [Embleya sp. NPDC005971]|uniref:integrase core domain-containing protein n=1 Tax=Embleya sp. NPDC005971 TaxID=3156724 RepID=UPI0033E41C45